MILSDKTIKQLILGGTITIDPTPTEDQYSPSALDLHLGDQFFRYKKDLIGQPGVDVTFDPHMFDFRNMSRIFMEEMVPATDDSIILDPGDLVFSTTREYLDFPLESGIAARVEGRSTLARIGLSVHLTAPTVHITFHGHLALEIKNHGELKLKLTPGMIICQLIFERVEGIPTKDIETSFIGQETPRGKDENVT